MTWITPKVDWVSTQQGVGNADFNRIEGNIKYLWEAGEVFDLEGNVYRTVTINNKRWTIDNCRSTKYNDGSDIPEVTDQAAWDALATPAYCKYGNGTTKFGLLYNWHVVDPANTKKIAIDGWRVPTRDEIAALRTFLIDNGYCRNNASGGIEVAQAVATQQDWPAASEAGAPGHDRVDNNSSRLSIPPGGRRAGDFEENRISANIWTQTDGTPFPFFLQVKYNQVAMNLFLYATKNTGMSLRLIRDVS